VETLAVFIAPYASNLGKPGYEKTAEIPAGRGLVDDFCGVGFVVGDGADQVEL
jgi:hypothetical protein